MDQKYLRIWTLLTQLDLMIHSFLELSGESMSIGATRRMLSIFRKLRKSLMASYGIGLKKVKMK